MNAFANPTGVAVLRETDFAQKVAECLADAFTLLMRRHDGRLYRTVHSIEKNYTTTVSQKGYLIVCCHVRKFLEERHQKIRLMPPIASVFAHFAGARDN